MIHIRNLGMTAALTVVVLACASPPPSPTPQPSLEPSPNATVPTQAPVESPSPSPSPLVIDETDLIVEIPAKHVPSRTTSLCDRQQDNNGSLEGVKPPLVCEDALLIGTRVAQLLSGEKPDRMYLERSDCQPCSADELHTGILHVWAAGRDIDVAIDSRMRTVTVLDPGGGDGWPRAGDSSAPPLGRPKLPDAPTSLQQRARLPLCGVSRGEPSPAAQRCFRDAVVELRPAELVYRYSTGEGLFVDRFDGTGALAHYSYIDGAWQEQRVALVLNPDGTAWNEPLV